ncbi:MAG: hypothetical protein LW822_00315 [Phycisphaeraceae bacterium]|jgi:hypothetical protein|nr:hypothetical protein [Phycisphaeraceae bacterium]
MPPTLGTTLGFRILFGSAWAAVAVLFGLWALTEWPARLILEQDGQLARFATSAKFAGVGFFVMGIFIFVLRVADPLFPVADTRLTRPITTLAQAVFVLCFLIAITLAIRAR